MTSPRSHSLQRSAPGERGSAILVTMIVVIALLGGGAVLVGMQMQSTRSAETARTGMTALYCAESGLNLARTLVATNYSNWNGDPGAGIPSTLCPIASGVGAQKFTGACRPDLIATTTQQATLAAFEPSWLSGINHDLDADGVNDFIITLVDNEDETGALDYSRDNDLRVYLVSTCIKFSEYPKQVSELVEFNAGTQCLKGQKGGCRGMGGGQ